MNIAMLLPYPYWFFRKIVRYMSVAGTSLAPLGPPPVSTKIRSKIFSEPISENVAQTFSMGFISGIVIDTAVRVEACRQRTIDAAEIETCTDQPMQLFREQILSQDMRFAAFLKRNKERLGMQ